MGFFFQVRGSASTYGNLNVNTSRTTNPVGLRDRSNKCDTERVICVSAAYRMFLFVNEDKPTVFVDCHVAPRGSNDFNKG